MASTSRRLLPETLTYTTYSYSLPPSLSPSPSPSPSLSRPDAFTCSSPFNCAWLYSSPPPSSSLHYPPTIHGSSPRLSAAGILAVSLISSLFLLLVYFFILSRLRRRRRNISRPRQPPPPGGSDSWDEEVLNENQAIVHPIWLINTVGLQPEVIGAISVCVYRKGEGLIEGDYCSICLSEFEEGEGA